MGYVQFSHSALEKLVNLTNERIKICGVLTRRQPSTNADFKSLEPLAQQYAIPCLLVDTASELELNRWVLDLKPDVIYCFGWSQLLSKELLQIPRLGVIGFHPAELPKNRGRHPLIWALALGLTQTATTFFFMDEGVDSGDLLSQKIIPIDENDHAGSLYQKMTATALGQIREFTPQLAANQFARQKQDHSQANYWRKRHKEEGRIDWRMSARSIHNLVRALAPPYPGAYCVYKHQEIPIRKTQRIHFEGWNMEPGKILDLDGRRFLIKCGEDAVWVLEHGFLSSPEKGEYL